jgi:pimeloyl-ACP methyl ester carboxylesterase
MRSDALSDASDSLSSDAVIRAVARYWELAAVMAIAGTVAAWWYAGRQPERYRASSFAVVAAAPPWAAITPDQAFDGVDNLERRLVVESLAALASTDVIRRRVHAKPGELLAGVLLPDTNLLRIDAEGTDPRRTALLANAAAAALNAESRAMFRMYPVALASPAPIPEKPVSHVERLVLAGLVLGTMAGAAAAWVVDQRMHIRR